MKGDLSLEEIAALIIMVLMTAVGLQIISTLNKNVSDTSISLNKFYPEINYPFCSDFQTKEKVSKDEFFRITYYRLKNVCKLEKQKLTADFVLKKDMLENKARKWGLKDSSGNLLVFYRSNCSSAQKFNVKGLKIGINNSEFLYRLGETIKISGTGKEVVIC
ncbi:MAG: hypothetical protein ABEJ93_03030 [Candidatus Nanohalobium sp.]